MYEDVEVNEKGKIIQTEKIENEIQKRLSCCDDEVPKVIGFSKDNDFIYYLSDNGYFCVWNFETLTLHKFIEFRKKSINMVVCKRSP